MVIDRMKLFWSSITILLYSYTYDCEWLTVKRTNFDSWYWSSLLSDDEIKIVLEGELHVSEEASGTSIVAKVGDVLNISNGAGV